MGGQRQQGRRGEAAGGRTSVLVKTSGGTGPPAPSAVSRSLEGPRGGDWGWGQPRGSSRGRWGRASLTPRAGAEVQCAAPLWAAGGAGHLQEEEGRSGCVGRCSPWMVGGSPSWALGGGGGPGRPCGDLEQSAAEPLLPGLPWPKGSGFLAGAGVSGQPGGPIPRHCGHGHSTWPALAGALPSSAARPPHPPWPLSCLERARGPGAGGRGHSPPRGGRAGRAPPG